MKSRFVTPRIAIALLASMLLLGNTLPTEARAEPPGVGDRAPDFDLRDQDGELRSLEDYRDGWVALYFYPEDDTPECTRQACEFRDDIYQYRRFGCQIIGVSLDDEQSHRDFAARYGLPFPLLADPQGATADAYGVKLRVAGTLVAKRQTFLIDPQGRIARHYANVDPENHSAEVLADLAELAVALAGDEQ